MSRRPVHRLNDWLGHMRECSGLGIMTLDTTNQWGVRAFNTGLQDVDGGYQTIRDAKTSLALYPKYNLPRAEIVRKIDGKWVNCW